MDEQRNRDVLLEGMSGRDILSLQDVSKEEIEGLISLAVDMKAERKRGHARTTLQGKSVALIFFKPSTRTRVSFEVALFELGAHPLVLHSDHLQIGRGETIEDTASVMSRYVHGLVIRTFAQSDIRRFAAAASIPVVNALTDDFHPVQILADLQTIAERFGGLQGKTLTYVGDGNNVAHSLMIGGCKTGMNVRVATPIEYMPAPEIVEIARKEADTSGGSITLYEDPVEAVQGTDVIYTDTWVSMGQDESERDEKLNKLKGYQINTELLKGAHANAVVMHCLPAHVGEEISKETYESPRSIVFDQTENRLHVQKALLASII